GGARPRARGGGGGGWGGPPTGGAPGGPGGGAGGGGGGPGGPPAPPRRESVDAAAPAAAAARRGRLRGLRRRAQACHEHAREHGAAHDRRAIPVHAARGEVLDVVQREAERDRLVHRPLDVTARAEAGERVGR